MINLAIKSLVNYGIKNEFLEESDRVFATNSLLSIVNLDTFSDEEITSELPLEEILNIILDYAVSQNIISDNITERDLFDTKIMGAITPKPSEVLKKFNTLYKEDPKKATDWYYDFSQKNDYIRTYRIKKDVRFVTNTEFGDIDITINLSKPEKDAKSIAAAKALKASSYPKCVLCYENEGYAGRINHPARQNHRIVPIKIANSDWFMQFSPYVYYNEHCIAFSKEHTPMAINHETFRKLLDFVEQFPHYFVGSNADLPIVGGSILSHDHFQGGNYKFAMEKAPIENTFTFDGFSDVEASIVKWPMSVIRLTSSDKERLIALSSKILDSWRNYTDEDAFIFSHTGDTEHNTITPIARMVDGKFQVDLVLRNNITTDKHPDGVYHPHKEMHHLKKENIGLIEVMGLAVLPARLKDEISKLKVALTEDNDLLDDEDIEKHKVWAKNLMKKHSFTKENVDSIIEKELGDAFVTILSHAGVYKVSDEGRENFLKFVRQV